MNDEKDKNALVPAEWLDLAEKLLKATANSRAPILKFKKGHYYIGDDEVMLGRKFRAYPGDWRRGWRKWKDKEVIDDRVVRVADDDREPVEREELDELDNSKWPIVDGESQDPWCCENQLPVEDVATGDLYLFVSSSMGGKIAVEILCQKFARNIHRGLPTIRLSVDEFNTRKFKHVPRPDFPVAEWENDVAIAARPMVDVTPPQDGQGGDEPPPWEPDDR